MFRRSGGHRRTRDRGFVSRHHPRRGIPLLQTKIKRLKKNKQTNGKTKQTNGKTNKQKNKQTEKQTNGKTNKRKNKQMEKQTKNNEQEEKD